MNRQEIVRLANDVRRNKVSGNYSVDEANSVLYNAVVDANGGKNYLDIRDIRDGKCSELFAIIEEVVADTKHDLLNEDPFFSQFVDYRNVAHGDKLSIYTPENEPFIVSEVAGGSQAIRRQRLLGGETVTVDTTWKAVKIYEEMELILANRVDFNAAIARVAESFKAKALEDIYTAWTGATAKLANPYLKTGTFAEAQMLDMIQHVKAKNGTRECYIMGTMLALAKVVGAYETNAQIAMEDLYKSGVVGYFYGTPKVEVNQVHKAGTDTFLLSDTSVDVIAASVKPIVYVTEGQTLILPRQYAENTDLTQEYLMMEKTGVVARIPDGEGKFGRYNF